MADSPQIAARLRVTGFDDAAKGFAQVRDSGRRAFQDITSAARSAAGATTSVVSTSVSVASGVVSVAQTAASGIGAVLGGISSTVSTVVGAVAGIGKAVGLAAAGAATAAAGAYVALNRWTDETAKGIVEIEDLANAATVPVDRFALLASAARQVNVDVKALSGGLKTLSGNVLSAATDESGAAAQAFFQLGLSARNADGSLKSADQVLFELADQLPKVANSMVRAKAASDLLGGSAGELGPLLSKGAWGIYDLADASQKFGTDLTGDDTAWVRGWLEASTTITEAFKGISYSLLGSFLPFFNSTSAATARWLNSQRATIAAWGGRVADTLDDVTSQITALATGDYGGVVAPWLRSLIPVADTLRGLLYDIVDVLAGGTFSRSPWIYPLKDAVVATVVACLALGTAVVGVMTTINGGEVPTATQAIHAVSNAIESLTAGFRGLDVATESMPWAAKIGAAARTVFDVLGELTVFLAMNREEITDFTRNGTTDLAEGLRAIGDAFSSGVIREGNKFQFLQPVVDGIRKARDVIIPAIGEIKKAFIGIFAWVGTVQGGFLLDLLLTIADLVAKGLGLKNWKELGVVAFILFITGFLPFVATLVTMFAASMTALSSGILFISNLINAFGLLGGALTSFTGLAATAAGGAIVAAGLLATYLVYEFWPEIKSVLGWCADKFIWFFKSAGNGASLVWDAFNSAFPNLVGFFGDIIDSIAGMFSRLWDGITSGAASAWNSVKSFFGFGSNQPASQQPGQDTAPRFASGGIVAGPSGTDRVRSWLTAGEGVLTTKAVKHYGADFVDALNSLAFPPTAFAGVPVPAVAGAGTGPGRFALRVGGIDVPGLYADDESTVKAMAKVFRSARRGRTGTAPRWKGGR
jgi:hypothetical protein